MLNGFLILLAVVVIEFPSSGLLDAVQKAASPVKRDASLSELGVNSDSSSGWYEHEDSITATKAFQGHSRKRDAPVETDVSAFGNRRSRSEPHVFRPDTAMSQTTYAMPLAQLEDAEDVMNNTEADLSNDQPEIQTFSKRSPNDYRNSGKKDVSLRATRPVKEQSPSNVKRQLSPEATMILHNIRMYQPYYALQPSESEDADIFDEEPISEISDANHVEKRDMAVTSEHPVESADESRDKPESLSESDVLQHDIGALSAPQPTDTESMVAYEQSPDAELSETDLNSVEGSQTPIQSSINITTSEADFTNQGVKRNVRRPSRVVKSYSSFQSFGGSGTKGRRQNSPLPGDSMPLFLASYYQQPRNEHKHKFVKPKCYNCGCNHREERRDNISVYDSFQMDTNNNLNPRQALKRNAKLLPNEMIDFDLRHPQQNLEGNAQAAPKSVVKRETNLGQSSGNLVKSQQYARVAPRESEGKVFPSEMLKFELDYTQKKLKNKNILNNILTQRRKRRPLYDLLKHEYEVNLVQKRDDSAVKREKKSIPLEMLKFELDYKKNKILEQKAQSPIESDMLNQYTKTYQSFNALQPTESDNSVTSEWYPESDSSNVQQELQTIYKRSSNEGGYNQKREAIKVTAEPKKRRSASSYGNAQLGPEASMIDNDMKTYQSLNSVQLTDSISAVSELENAKAFEQNPESDSLRAQKSLETISKRSCNESVKIQKRDAIEVAGQPKERSTSSYGNIQLSSESRMDDPDTKQLYQLLNEMEPAESENDITLEQDPESDSSNAQQSLQATFKRISNDDGYSQNQKRDTIKKSEQPNESSASSSEETQNSPEASMIDNDSNMYQPLNSLQLAQSENAETFEQDPDSDISNAQQSLSIRTAFKRSSNENGYNQKRNVIKISAQPKERSASTYRKIRLSPETSMVDHYIKIYQPFYALQPSGAGNGIAFVENPDSYSSNGQESLQTHFERSTNENGYNQKRDASQADEQTKKIGASLYRTIQSNPEASMDVNRDIEINQPFYTVQANEFEIAEPFEENQEAELSNAQPLIKSSFKRSLDGQNHNLERDIVMRSAHSKASAAGSYEKRESSPELELINRDIKLYQPYYALPPIDSLNAATLNDDSDAGDSSVAIKRSLNGTIRDRKSLGERGSPYEKSEPPTKSELVNEAFNLLQPVESVNAETLEENPAVVDSSIDQPSLQSPFKRSLNGKICDKKSLRKRGFPYKKGKSSSESDLVNREFNLLQPVESVNAETLEGNLAVVDSSIDQPSLQSPFKRSLNGKIHDQKSLRKRGFPYKKSKSSPESDLVNQEFNLLQPVESVNDETLEENPAVVDSSIDQPSLQSPFKRSLNGAIRDKKSLRKRGSPYKKSQSSSESEIVNREFNLLQPVESVDTETLEENSAVGDSSIDQPSLQSSFQRSLIGKIHTRKRDMAKRSGNPLERVSGSHVKRGASPESELVNRDIKLYQPFYALPARESENAETLERTQEAVDSSDAHPLTQYAVKRSCNRTSTTRKRGTLVGSTRSDEGAVNLHGQR